MTILVRLQYNAATEAGEHTVLIRLLNVDGADVMPAVSLAGRFPDGQRSFNIIATLEPHFISYGAHSVEIAVDRLSVASIPLSVLEARTGSSKNT